MDRRTFLKTTTAAAAATSAAGVVQGQALAESFPQDASDVPAAVAARGELRIALPAEPYLYDAALTLMRDISIASEGRIVFSSEAAAASVDDIASGGFDGTFGQLSEICKAPELALFSGLPGDMALPPSDLLAWHSAAAGEMFLDDAADDYGLTAMICGHSGASIGMWANRAISDLEAIAAADIKTVGMGAGIVSAIRATHGTSAMKSAPAQLTELPVPLLEAFSNLPSEYRQIWYRQGLHNQGHATMLVLSRKAWNGLSAGEQRLVQSMALTAAHRNLARVRANERMIAPSVFAHRSIKQKTMPANIATRFQHVARQVVHDEISRNPRVEPAFQAYQAFYNAMMGLPLARPTTGLV